LWNIVFEEPIVPMNSALDPDPFSVVLTHRCFALPQQHECAGGNQQ